MRIITEYSLWFLPLCILIGLVVAYILYNRDVQLRDFPKKIKILLFVFRATTLSVILFLLLGPFLEINKKDIQKPVVVILQDNSASIVMHKDSTIIRNKYVKDLQEFSNKLKQNFDVDVYEFGEGLYHDSLLNFKDKQTNISDALRDVSTRYYNRNLGAIVLSSDGIYNSGENPVYIAQNMLVASPIYTVALGNPQQVRDNVISDVIHNAIAFRNNQFVVRLVIESHNLKGKKSKISVYDSKQKVFETTVISNLENFYKEIDCKLISKEEGQKVYKVVIQSQDGEVSYKNNSFTFSIDVLESRQKVLMLFDAVHPDVAAVRRALETNQNFTVTVSSAKNFSGNISDYNCVILHGMPQAYGVSKEIVKKVIDAKVPILFLYNSTSQLSLLESIGVGVSVNQRNSSFDEVQPKFDNDFSLFELDAETKNFLETAPPLFAPFGNYNSQIQAKVVCWQSINGMQLNRPLIICNEVQGVKIGFICGEGLWRWRMYNYKKNASCTYFDSFINKLTGYIALTQKRDVFAVLTKHIISDNEDIMFHSELYNKSFEPLVDKEISLVLKDEKGKEYPYTFVSNNDFYKLQIGKFPPGEYSYKATVSIDGEKLVRKGVIVIMPLQIEFKQTKANHSILKTISDNSGGIMVKNNEFEKLYNAIQDNKDIVPISHLTQQRTGFIDSMIILILLILFAGAEWFLRKFYGSY